MLFFSTRSASRAFAIRSHKKLVDCGANAPTGRRWAVDALNRK